MLHLPILTKLNLVSLLSNFHKNSFFAFFYLNLEILSHVLESYFSKTIKSNMVSNCLNNWNREKVSDLISQSYLLAVMINVPPVKFSEVFMVSFFFGESD